MERRGGGKDIGGERADRKEILGEHGGFSCLLSSRGDYIASCETRYRVVKRITRSRRAHLIFEVDAFTHDAPPRSLFQAVLSRCPLRTQPLASFDFPLLFPSCPTERPEGEEALTSICRSR